MPYLGGATGLILLGLWLFAIFDVIGTDESLCRNLPKGMWLILVVFLPAIGSISWLIMGRPERAGFSFGGATFGGHRGSGEVPYRSAVRPRGLEDAPQYLSRSQELDRQLEAWEAEQAARAGDAKAIEGPAAEGRDLAAWEAELARREKELRRREATVGNPADPEQEGTEQEGTEQEGTEQEGTEQEGTEQEGTE